ncbi:class I adenylate-forming enzyme family protein [Mangrovicella endophytica]|uniref:class I adenylate-forming enzyme family protein n=1 Tax=Mangrovicella endophytica TaxID=2066697 RepID=UPI000C9E71D5|nr:fatty acid--CoA ligase family protein [Mangrovicella endophytica]
MMVPSTLADLVALMENGRFVGDRSAGGATVDLQPAISAAATMAAAYHPGDRVRLRGIHGNALLHGVHTLWRRGLVPVLGAEQLTAATWTGEASLFDWDGLTLQQQTHGTPDHDPPALLQATSGSTRHPKLVARGAASLLDEAQRYAARYGFAAGQRALIAAPVFHSFAFGAALALISAGASVECQRTPNPAALARRLRAGDFDVVVLTPAIARLAVKAQRGLIADGESSCLVIAGAGPVPDALDAAFRRSFGCALARNYGSTETGATFGEPASLPEGRIGRPFNGITILAPPPDGSMGELVLSLGHAILGEEGSALSSDHAAGIWRTGDVVRREADGSAVLIGRLADRLKINGHSIDGAALTQRLRALPGVTDALAICGPERHRGGADALILALEGPRPDPAIIREALAEVPAVPTRIVTMPALPRTAAGKIDRLQLLAADERAGERAGAAISSYQA